jgi:RNA polymerase sigma factor (sigma-70 family)
MDAARTSELRLDRFVHAAASGDHEAYACLIDATRTLVSSIALAIVRDFDLSRDVAQDVFLAAWRDLGKLRDPASFLPWLRQITRNRAHEVVRHRRRQRQHAVSDEAADKLLAAAVDPRPDVVERLVQDEELRLVLDSFEGLPGEAREVITLYYREGQSARQVAALLGLSEDAVKKRLSRARVRLRDSVLARAGAALQHTAPDAAFTAGVIVALGPASPGAGTAASVGLSKWFVGSGAVVKALAAASGALLGGASGIGAVLIGSRGLQRKALDERERRERRQFTILSIAVVPATVVAMPVVSAVTRRAWPQVVIYGAFLASLSLLCRVRLPGSWSGGSRPSCGRIRTHGGAIAGSGS